MSVDRHCKEGTAQASQGSANKFIMLKEQVDMAMVAAATFSYHG